MKTNRTLSPIDYSAPVFPADSGRLLCKEPECQEADPFTERHLHCVWSDARLRPRQLTSTRGEEVVILHPGDWNQQKGPDFLQAEWTVDGRHFQGDVEIHIRPLDWQTHGHESDPAYDQVRLHVTYENGELDPETLPAGCTQISLCEALSARSHFFFQSIDTSAYPWTRDRTVSGLRHWFDGQEDEACRDQLQAAGLERLRRKAQRLQKRIRAVGPEQALYQQLMRGLGYYENAETMEKLASQVPLARLTKLCRGDVAKAYALLCGCSGLLGSRPDPPQSPFMLPVRQLWDIWWKEAESFSGQTLSGEAWKLHSLRPGNHPLRRLWAAAVWSQSLEDLISSDSDDTVWLKNVEKELTVDAPDAIAQSRVVGRQRVAALMINAVIPWRLCTDPSPLTTETLECLPSEPMNTRSRRAVHHFLGPDRHPRIYRSALSRQGLIQLTEDFGG